MSKVEANNTPQQQPPADATPDALPKKSVYFDSMRTNAFLNKSGGAEYVEFWMALRVDEKEDKWRVLHHRTYDLGAENGKWIVEIVTKNGNVPFIDAVATLANTEYVNVTMAAHAARDKKSDPNESPYVDMEKKYPGEKYPEVQVHFHDVEYYKTAANIEGFAFDVLNQPYQRVQGKVVSTATFKPAEIRTSILAVEQARQNDKVRERIEDGILSDLLSVAVKPYSSLDEKLMIGEAMLAMDNFTIQVGAYYLAVQKALGLEANIDDIEWPSPAQKADFDKRARAALPGNVRAYEAMIEKILPKALEYLDKAASLKIHDEPFRKFATECELYAHLLYAGQNLSKLDKAYINPNDVDINLITEVRRAIDNAQKKFLDLGGTLEKMDALKAWINDFARLGNDPQQQMSLAIPVSLVKFIGTYYKERADIMKGVQARTAGLRHVRVMQTRVKPPVTDEFNESAVPKKEATAPETKKDLDASRSKQPEL